MAHIVTTTIITRPVSSLIAVTSRHAKLCETSNRVENPGLQVRTGMPNFNRPVVSEVGRGMLRKTNENQPRRECPAATCHHDTWAQGSRIPKK